MTTEHLAAVRPRSSTPRQIALAASLDLATIVVFVILGRRTHDSGGTLTATITTLAPFVIGLAVAWMATRAWRSPERPLTGVIIWAITIVVGLVARVTVFDRTAATAFIIVAAAVTAAGLIGWRLIAFAITRRDITRRDIGSTR